MTALMMFLSALLVLTPLIALHEWGHYIVARLCGVKVLTYSIGFGKRLFGWTSPKTGIDYRICAIPLGGYVRMLDEREAPVEDHEKHLAFNNQHPLKKIAIVVAGPLMNFIIAVGLFFVLFLQPSQELSTHIGKMMPESFATQSSLQVDDKILAVDGQSVQTWQDINYRLIERMGETGTITMTVSRDDKVFDEPITVRTFMQGDQKGLDPFTALGILPWRPDLPATIKSLTPDGAGSLMGLKAGDTIVSIDDKSVADWYEVANIIQNNPEKALIFGVLRDGKTLDVRVMPRATKTSHRIIGQIGARPEVPQQVQIPEKYRMTVSHTPAQAVPLAFAKTYELSKMTLTSMGKMITGLVGIENLSGPITIAQISKDSIEIGFEQVLSTMALISISLAVLNLLPIPVLDGGHLVFYGYELIRGKPMSQTLQNTGLRLGFALLLCFMILAISNDIMRVFG